MMYICADIGGTNARLELYTDSGLRSRSPLYRKTYNTELLPSFLGLFKMFLKDSACSEVVDIVVCGIPGDVSNNQVGMSH